MLLTEPREFDLFSKTSTKIVNVISVNAQINTAVNIILLNKAKQ